MAAISPLTRTARRGDSDLASSGAINCNDIGESIVAALYGSASDVRIVPNTVLGRVFNPDGVGLARNVDRPKGCTIREYATSTVNVHIKLQTTVIIATPTITEVWVVEVAVHRPA